MRQGGHLSCHWPKLGRAKCLSFQKLFQFEKKKRRKRLRPDLGAQGLGSPCHPQSLGPLLGHHFLELWVLVQVTPISSLDLKLLDLKAPPGHISLSQLLLPTCSDSRSGEQSLVGSGHSEVVLAGVSSALGPQVGSTK